MFSTGWLGAKWADVNLRASGLTFASLAGVAGAVGAICVVFATTSAVRAAMQSDPPLPRETYKVFIAPLIFALAPVINVLVSMVWHPRAGDPWHFHLEVPGWKLWVGIVFVGVGAALVLFSKEESEATHAAVKPAAGVAVMPSKAAPHPEANP
jgi:hypothetical protein